MRAAVLEVDHLTTIRLRLRKSKGLVARSGFTAVSFRIMQAGSGPPLLKERRQGMDIQEDLLARACRIIENNCPRSHGLVRKSRIPKD